MSPSSVFASDNCAPVHPKVMEALQQANDGSFLAYGNDPFTEKAVALLREHFDATAEVFLVGTGTAANVLALKAIAQAYHAILASQNAHVYVDECNAPENFIGCRVTPIKTDDGKITINRLRRHMDVIGNEHHPQPGVISLTQSNEYGIAYTLTELQTLCEFAHDYGLYVHMDGARLANAAATLGATLREMTCEAGVDVVSFGGTKNGLMFGEAVIFFDPKLAKSFKYIRKQGMQLFSKMRYIAAQFIALLEDDLWLSNAQHANTMARYLAERLRTIPKITVTQPVGANAVYCIIRPRWPGTAKLREAYEFCDWNESTHEVRLMCSYATTTEDVDQFIQTARQTIGDTM